MWKKAMFSILLVCMMVIMLVPAYAYIDPSAVTYTAQAIAAVVVALCAVVTVFRHKIAALFKKNGDNKKREIHVMDEDLVDTAEKSEQKDETDKETGE